MESLLVFLVYLVTATSAQTVCGETSYYGPYGVITSPNYPLLYDRNLDCNYYVYASTGSSLSFFFKFLDVEEIHDTVTISCPANSSFPPQTFYGQSLPDPISFPWCSLGLVNFHSDDSTVARGFILKYYVSDGGCGNTVYTNSTGYMFSPNYPNNYGNNQSCLNIIWAPQRSTFWFYFLLFHLDSCCNCDWLEVICLDNSQYGPYSYCGDNGYSEVYIYECSQMLLWFRSDFALTSQGFNIQYAVSLDGGATVPPTTPTPPQDCSYLNYYGPSGVITSPNYPGDYDNSLRCQYFIRASEGSSIAIIFEHFDVQEDRDYLDISCETSSSFPRQRYSGHTLPQPLSMPWCGWADVYFYTDNVTAYTGFSIDYYVSQGCGNTTYTESVGNITSPNYPSNYGDNQDCYNIIYAEQPSHFHIEYIDFNVQGSDSCSLDYVEISCLDNNPSYKHRFCASYVYSLDFHYCTQVLVWFHSDNTTNFQGFYLEYNIVQELGCGEESHYGPLGAINSINFPEFYNNSLFCDYGIYTGSSNGSIAIIFNALFTEECCDFVTISCPTNSSYTPVTYSGYSQTVPEPVSIPWCSQGNVNFRTDDTISLPGFSLDYYVSVGGCGDTVYTEVPGFISSPNHPSIYGDNQNCSNIIWVEKATNFTIQFLHMDTEECCDFVEISCLDNPVYGTHRFSGNTIPEKQDITECTRVLVWFFSDYSSVFSGFNLEYSVVPLVHETTVVSGTTVVVETSSTSQSPVTTVTPITNCGNTSYSGPSGVISSPNYPGNYSSDVSCDYYVNASSSSSSIAIIFLVFNTDDCCDFVTISCPTNSVFPSVRYSGSSLPQPLSIPWCSEAAVNFNTDGSVVSTGFSLEYHISLGGCGDTVYTGTHGYVSSPKYPSSYDANQNCSNIIWSRLRSSFSFIFQYMNIEECCDFVELSCLDNAEFGRHRFTGTSNPPKLDIPGCTQVLVWFYSDDTVVYNGFNLEYFATRDPDDHRL